MPHVAHRSLNPGPCLATHPPHLPALAARLRTLEPRLLALLWQPACLLWQTACLLWQVRGVLPHGGVAAATPAASLVLAHGLGGSSCIAWAAQASRSRGDRAPPHPATTPALPGAHFGQGLVVAQGAPLGARLRPQPCVHTTFTPQVTRWGRPGAGFATLRGARCGGWGASH